MYAGEGVRTVKEFIKFPLEFEKTPNVICSLSGIDASTKTNIRIDVNVETVTKEGFEVVATTSSDTKIASLNISWIAISI